MTRSIRHLPHTNATVEITQRTAEGRFLFRPSERLNAIIAGCLSRAQKITDASVHAVAVMSNHFHILATFETVEQMSKFMCHLKTNLSKEIRRFHGWKGPVFEGRYQHVPLSSEAEIQVQRLRYILQQGAKEGLVLSPRDWPGVHCAKVLDHGEPIRGVWVNRTEYYQAKQKNREVLEAQFTNTEELHLTPLPCWAEIPVDVLHEWISDIIEGIELETKKMHRRQGTAPSGAQAICSRDPSDCANQLTRTAKPKFHATRAGLRPLLEGLREFTLAYRAAAERLAAGHRNVHFPENCYPPGLPFVEPAALLAA